MKVFHHNDHDGRLSAFLVRHFVRKHDPDIVIEFIETNFDLVFPIERILPDEQVWIVDFSIEPDMMKRLLGTTQTVLWLDHHGTSIEKYKDWSVGGFGEIDGLRRTNAAACALTYEFCHKRYEGRRHRSIPMFIRLVSDRDIWTWKFGNRTKYFHRGLQAEDTSPMSDMWYAAWKSTVWLEKRGVIIESALAQQARRTIEQCGFEVEFHGYRCFAMNASVPFLRSSEYFEEFAPHYDIWISFKFANGCWSVSMYSKAVDTSVIAKKYVYQGKRGGGHPLTERGSASGFQCESLPWKKNWPVENPQIITPRCLICGRACDLYVTEMEKAGWLDKPVYYSPGQDMRIVICPEHNTQENFEKAIRIKKKRIQRAKFEDALPDWHFGDDSGGEEDGR